MDTRSLNISNGLSSIQEYKNIDKVTHQVKTNKHIFPRSKIDKTIRHPVKFSKLRVKKTTAKLSKSRSKFLTLTKTQWFNSKFKIKWWRMRPVYSVITKPIPNKVQTDQSLVQHMGILPLQNRSTIFSLSLI